MTDRLNRYAEHQRKFWDTPDVETARWARVHTLEHPDDRAWAELAQADAALVLRDIHPAADWTIVEIGCGVGRLVDQLRVRVPFRRLVGLDISPKMHE